MTWWSTSPRPAPIARPAATPANWAGETVIDELAVQIGMDPLEFRLRNRAQEGTRQINGSVHTNIGCHEVLQAAQEHPHYRAPLRRQTPRPRRGVWTVGKLGRGIEQHDQRQRRRHRRADHRSVDVTGTRTSLAMQVAEVLGLSVDQVESTTAGTDSIGFTQVSAGSRTTVATGLAVVKAAHDVIAQMRERAAAVWDVDRRHGPL